MTNDIPETRTKASCILVTLSQIPYGKVCSYGEIAKRSGFPGLSRYVARILKELPEDSTLPWHRVINSQGKISFPKQRILQFAKTKAKK